MSFIEDFYNGKLEPQKRNLKQNTAYRTDFRRLCETKDILKEKLEEDEKSLLLSI